MTKVYVLTTLIISFVFISSNVVSQIVYTDVDPDTTISEFQQGYGVDFNHDDKIDLHITLLSNVGVWVMHLIPDSGTDFTYVVYDGEEASVLVDNDYISESSDFYHLGDGWGSLLYGYWEDDGEFGNWTGVQEDKYLGIKFEIGDNFHYGWIKLSTTIYNYDDMEFTLHGFAYNTVADEGIKAGDKGQVGVLENEVSVLTVYPNPAKNIINLPLFVGDGTFSISDVSGRIVWQSHLQTQENTTVDVSMLDKGLYIVRCQIENKIFSTKFLKD